MPKGFNGKCRNDKTVNWLSCLIQWDRKILFILGQFCPCPHGPVFQIFFIVTLIATLAGADSVHLLIHKLFIKGLLHAGYYIGY